MDGRVAVQACCSALCLCVMEVVALPELPGRRLRIDGGGAPLLPVMGYLDFIAENQLGHMWRLTSWNTSRMASVSVGGC